MTTPGVPEQFVAHLTACQNRLYAYIMALLPDPQVASDVLQEANLVLCRRAAEYDTKDDFVGWACRIAYFQVLAHRRDAARDDARLIFDPELMQLLADDAADRTADYEPRRLALRQCIERLPDPQRELLTRRYERGQSIASVAESVHRPAGSITQTLHRIRRLLLDCITRTLAAQEHA